MTVEKTARRNISLMTRGSATVMEYVLACPCKRKEPSGMICRERSSELATRVARGGNYGYDIEVFAGIERFVHHKQRREIKNSLMELSHVNISDGEISALEARFLSHIKALHILKADDLKRAMADDGGCPMHLDSTCEDGRGMTLTVYAGWRNWVLGAWKIPSEREDAITPRLKETKDLFGAPNAYVSDLGKGVMQAAANAAAAPDIALPSLFVCHTHFVKVVGKSMLVKDNDRLTASMRETEIKSKLAGIAKKIGHKLSGLPGVRVDLAAWAEMDGLTTMPTGSLGLGAVRMICQWVLDYVADCGGLRFPFALPQLCLFRRCETASINIANLQSRAVSDIEVGRWLERVQNLLLTVLSDKSISSHAKSLQEKERVFLGFRRALRLDSYDPAEFSQTHCGDVAADSEMALEMIKECLNVYCSKIRARHSQKRGTKAELEAMLTVISYIDKYDKYLWGHSIAIGEGKYRLVDRANNTLESLFGIYKKGERRRSGRKCLTYDLEAASPDALLTLNLNNSDYLDIVCGGSLGNLPALFAMMDQQNWRDKCRVTGNIPNITPTMSENDIVSTALPLEDRQLVRTDVVEKLMFNLSVAKMPTLDKALDETTVIFDISAAIPQIVADLSHNLH
jgi:hypothetical protein